MKYQIPEGMTPDIKKTLKSIGSKKSLNDQSIAKATVGQDAKKLLKKGLKYKFKLNDLGKYSQNLKFKDINTFKLERSALGKIIPDETERRKRLAKVSYLNKLLKILKYTDWTKTPVYH